MINTASSKNAHRWLIWLSVPLGILTALVFLLGRPVLWSLKAYLYGYPLVIMDVTRSNANLLIGPTNQLTRVPRFPDASFHEVVRPNVDTLYTTAFIDAEAGPWVFEMAANQERYEVVQVMDAWSNVFASLGTRTPGPQGGRYLITAPGWQGKVPEGMTRLAAPTSLVWLIGRTQTNGVADYPLIHRLQKGLKLHRLGAPDDDGAPAMLTPPQQRPAAPVQQLKAMSGREFFERLAALMVKNPPAEADTAMLKTLADIGARPGQPLDWGWRESWASDVGRNLADLLVARQIASGQPLVNGWATPPAQLGAYGTDYGLRAGVAMVGLGANLPLDAMYPSARVDGTGQRLHGQHRYRLHFAPGERPPVKAFWSITAYGPDEFLIANPENRYALGDRDPLEVNKDGSLDLWIQAHPPEDGRRSNWLPVSQSMEFALTARLYWPEAQALDGRWHMPPVQRID
jgi:hypothetical protein